MKMTGFEIGRDDILLVIDVQRDFCAGGSLAVPDGDAVAPIISELAGRFDHVVLTQDWHPAGDQSFASSHEGKEPFETIELSYGRQVLWPVHCVQGTPGAEFHAGLSVTHGELILRKGYNPAIDSYSAFFENDKKTPTGLGGYLRERGLNRVFLAGLALDFCVRFSAEDAHRLEFEAVVIEDACRAIDIAGSLNETRQSFSALEIDCIASVSLA
jgi:nicotinamidase/pyrazinamidase